MKQSASARRVAGFALSAAVLCGLCALPGRAGPADETFAGYNIPGDYRLELDETTSNITVTNLASGGIFTGFDPAAAPDQEAASLLLVQYCNQQGEEFVLHSGPDSVQRNQFSFEPIDNGVRLQFTLGREQGNYRLPAAISARRMQSEVLDHIEDEWDQQRVTAMYVLLAHCPPDELVQLSPEEQKSYKETEEKYPLLKTEDIYVLGDVTEGEIERLEELFTAAGYTAEMAEVDNKAAQQSGVNTQEACFKITVELTMDGGSLLAVIPAGSVSGNAPFELHSVTLLPYFGADGKPAATRQEGLVPQGGFLLFPDGAGTLIPFTGGDTADAPIMTSLAKRTYGENHALTPMPVLNVEQAARMPVFGLSRQQDGYLAIIESGDAIAEICARTAGSGDGLNRAYSRFIYRDKDTFDFGDWGGAGFAWTVFEKQGYTGAVRVRYLLLENATLARMAQAYRDVLLQDGTLKALPAQNSVPFYLETMGTFTRKTTVLGLSVKAKTSLTTFSQAEQMLTQLSEDGIDRLQLQFVGAANGGMENRAYNRFDVESALGGKRGFKQLAAYAADRQVGFFPDVELTYVTKNGLFDGFSPNSHAIRALNEKYGGDQALNVSDALENSSRFRFVLNAGIARNFAGRVAASVRKFNLQGISLGSLGTAVSADHGKNKTMNRQDARDVLVAAAGRFSDQSELLTAGGNAYLWGDVRHLVRIPERSSGFASGGLDVPFMQMVLHGHIEYAGEPANLSGDPEAALLNAARMGGGLMYTLNYDHTRYLTETTLSDYYATDYEYWRPQAAADYQRLNSALGAVYSQTIIDFDWLAGQVSKTVYESGACLLVNSGAVPYTYQGTTVNPRDFVLVQGGDVQ